MNKKNMKTLMLYPEDFHRDKIWYDVCDCLQIPQNSTQARILYVDVGFKLEEEDEPEEVPDDM